VSECDREAWIMRRPWPPRGCSAMERKRVIFATAGADSLLSPNASNDTNTWPKVVSDICPKKCHTNETHCSCSGRRYRTYPVLPNLFCDHFTNSKRYLISLPYLLGPLHLPIKKAVPSSETSGTAHTTTHVHILTAVYRTERLSCGCRQCKQTLCRRNRTP
jgi:hypothetical protein